MPKVPYFSVGADGPVDPWLSCWRATPCGTKWWGAHRDTCCVRPALQSRHPTVSASAAGVKLDCRCTALHRVHTTHGTAAARGGARSSPVGSSVRQGSRRVALVELGSHAIAPDSSIIMVIHRSGDL